MGRKLIIGTIGFLLPILLCPLVFADKWLLPKPKKYYSANKRYCFEVIPRKLESPLKYSEDLAKEKMEKDAGLPEGVKDNYCKGILYELRAPDEYIPKWTIQLTNDEAPVNVLVSDSGDYIVTFDNWHSEGYGDNVVVIYGSNGNLIKKFGLEDILSNEEIAKIPVSVSSRLWYGGSHYLDEENKLLILKVVTDKDDGMKVKIDLTRGSLIRIKQLWYPQTKSLAKPKAGIGEGLE